jgi:hypothetical protein
LISRAIGNISLVLAAQFRGIGYFGKYAQKKYKERRLEHESTVARLVKTHLHIPDIPKNSLQIIGIGIE